MKILIVEDDPVASTLLAKIVGNGGHQTTVAADGEEAWELLNDLGHSFDVVMLDLSLPKLDGFELMRRIKSTSFLRAIEVVFCTAANDRATVLKIVQLGGRHYFVKPVNAEKVLATLQKLQPHDSVGVERTLVGN